MFDPAQTALVTGIAGNLGVRLLAQVPDWQVVGLDLKPPDAAQPLRFEPIDLGEEASCWRLVELLRETQAETVVHLAFVIDPVRTGVLDLDRIWRINVAGTARVAEAIALVNRTGGRVRKFVFLSSVSAYGSDLPGTVTEDFPLGGHTLPYAIHKRQSDDVVRARADSLGDCSVYVLRPHIFAGASMQNYLIAILRNTPYGEGRVGRWLCRRGIRLPALLPFGQKFLETQFQFVHVDDVARLIAFILRRKGTRPEVVVLNVAGRGEALPFWRCAQIGGTRILRLPGHIGCRAVLRLVWNWGVSCVPPEAEPYFTGSYCMNTSRLQQFLGSDYENVIRYTIEDALADSFTVTAEAGVPVTQTVAAGR